MTFKLLIDECLSPELVQRAIDAGYLESTCIRYRGLAGTKDWRLIEHVVANDFTFVTNNSIDFRGSSGHPGGLHAKQPIHAGLICLNSAQVMDLARQHDLFGIVLSELAGLNDLINTALEVSEAEDGAVKLKTYTIPHPA
ncbi:hypothetical protein FNU76_12800 [Chitinimonas arctica]|uniref:DUF5615 domain-containing protein n=1 Tax=Chitinimonas arctica TaxID=2594795 RepID=A0A516SGE4_9NEIS|nr:DUF5615 family PIN-like protein [Chitinimonas arctica]QDQ27170.1 hypothetical protein FNU76_12800 [Chitinimonas arctica]